MIIQYLLNLTPAFTLSGIFTQIGKAGGIINDINGLLGTTLPPEVNELGADYPSPNQGIVDNLFSNFIAFQNSGFFFISRINQICYSTITTYVNTVKDLPTQQVTAGIIELIAEMQRSLQTVSACTVGISYTPGGANSGNPVFVFSLKNNYGYTCENIFQEVIAAYCSASAQSGNATLGQEPIQFRGQPAVASLSPTYPQGSGCNQGAMSVNGAVSQQGGRGNWLNNSGFDTFTTPNVPNNWNIGPGVAGTQVLQSTSIYYDSNQSSVAFVGDGVTNTRIYQIFGSGTGYSLIPLDQLAFNAFIYLSSVPAAGVLEIALTDENGMITFDYNGVPNVASFNLPSLPSLLWVAINGVFRTSRVLPPTSWFKIRLSTPLSAGTTLYIDRLGFAEMTTLYPMGPSVVSFSGNTNLAVGDSWEVLPTNDYGGAFQVLFDQLFNMRQNGLVLPSTTGTPTFPNSLVS